jgi:uncharacterized membrane protein HdeD (DUF308 family)
MATALHPGSATTPRTFTAIGEPAHQAYLILYVGFAALPIIAGIDKFFDLLTNWDTYLAPVVTQTLNMNAHPFMMIVGVIEIAAGLLVAFRPQIGAYIVAIWLWGIIVNLFLLGGALDIALRDFGLSLGALALARISAVFSSRPFGV